jgi:DNA primase
MNKTDNWVDFKDLKERITLEMVLSRYGIIDQLKKSGNNLVGRCPIHQGTNPRQFSVDPKRNIFNCFGNCKSGGNVLDFVAKMENVPVRSAALKLKEWFPEAVSEIADSPGEGVLVKETEKPAAKAPDNRTEAAEEPESPVEINPPLPFQLKSLSSEHAFFGEKGIRPATVEYFGLGFSTKGMMKGRIAIPIHNEKGELVAYCGRAVDAGLAELEGKYKLPPNFVKSAVVYNLHRQAPEAEAFILVESFFSVFRLYQAGYSNALSLMGSALSERQEELILKRLGKAGRIYLMFDADESGRNCTADCLGRLGYKAFVKAVDIGGLAQKPHRLTSDQLKELLA